MYVIATAGHVDHGKSTLVRALTGQDPDRLEEEHRRGLSIELGYVWMSLPGTGDVAFVDVPGHERFVSTMLAGVGPVPAVLFVVAADDPWMPQAAEHLAALDAFGVRNGVVAVTRSDLAEPGPSMASAGRNLAGTSLRDAPIVAVSTRDGSGLVELRTAIAAMVSHLAEPPRDAAVRIWVDRCFSVVGAGTVVTGTLPAGTIDVGDELSTGNHTVRIRGIETLGRPTDSVHGVARVALRLGSGSAGISRGTALFEPSRWQLTTTLDIRVTGSTALPARPMLHIGAASVQVWSRGLDAGHWRIQLDRALPIQVGDLVVLRDPGSRTLCGATVLDPAPPALDRRGAARRRAASLAESTGRPDLADELRRRRVARISQLRRLGVADHAELLNVAPDVAVRAGDWLLDASAVPDLQHALRDLAGQRLRSHPLEPGLLVSVAAQALELPAPQLVQAIVAEPLALVDGRVVDTRATLPDSLLEAVRTLRDELSLRPFAAPDSGRLAELGLDGPALATAARAGLVLRLDTTVVLMPGADGLAVRLLTELPQPFTTSHARAHLDTTRRVVLPLLQWLDRQRLTRRLPDDRREVVVRSDA